MASAAAGAGNESPIDLRPYGFNLTLTAELTHSQYVHALREGAQNVRYIVSENVDSCIFKSKEDTLQYKKIKKITTGHYGSVFVYADPDGKKVAIKKISFDDSDPLVQTANFLRECIIQIILAETSKQYNQVNIGVPITYKIGLSQNKYEGFIVFELMEDTLFDFLLSKDNEEIDIIIPDALLQVAGILDFFQKKLRFNHRDMKTDNIMYTMVDGRPIYKIIDFGMSCLMWNQLNIVTTIGPYSTCFREGRDLAQLIYELLSYNRNLSVRLKEWMLQLKLAPDGTSWFNSYRYFNRQTIFQATPQKITTGIQGLPFYRPFVAPAAAASAAPAPSPASAAALVNIHGPVKAKTPLGSLSLSPSSSLNSIASLNIELTGTRGGYKRKGKCNRKKTRNLRKRRRITRRQ